MILHVSMVLQSWMQLSNLAQHPPNHCMESQRAVVNEGDTEGMGREEREEAQRDGWFLDPRGLSSAEHPTVNGGRWAPRGPGNLRLWQRLTTQLFSLELFNNMRKENSSHL